MNENTQAETKGKKYTRTITYKTCCGVVTVPDPRSIVEDPEGDAAHSDSAPSGESQ